MHPVNNNNNNNKQICIAHKVVTSETLKQVSHGNCLRHQLQTAKLEALAVVFGFEMHTALSSTCTVQVWTVWVKLNYTFA